MWFGSGATCPRWREPTHATNNGIWTDVQAAPGAYVLIQVGWPREQFGVLIAWTSARPSDAKSVSFGYPGLQPGETPQHGSRLRAFCSAAARVLLSAAPPS